MDRWAEPLARARKPYGPGWALVGDAGYNRDFITGQGIMDAFHDAELCAVALDKAFSGAQPFDAAMSEYQRARDARVKAMYEFTCMLATLEPPPPEMRQLFGAVYGNRKAVDEFARMNAGTISPAEFFAPENVNAITAPKPASTNTVHTTTSVNTPVNTSAVNSQPSAEDVPMQQENERRRSKQRTRR
jgi:2-polyprenyl-6-methoxyphenol hydroxylase-like FAD-dependent oxidoreductase